MNTINSIVFTYECPDDYPRRAVDITIYEVRSIICIDLSHSACHSLHYVIGRSFMKWVLGVSLCTEVSHPWIAHIKQTTVCPRKCCGISFQRLLEKMNFLRSLCSRLEGVSWILEVWLRCVHIAPFVLSFKKRYRSHFYCAASPICSVIAHQAHRWIHRCEII